MVGESKNIKCCNHCKNDSDLVIEIRLLSQELIEMKSIVSGVASNRWMTTKEVAEYACMSIKQIHRAVKAGLLKCGKRTGQWRFKREWIDKYIMNN